MSNNSSEEPTGGEVNTQPTLSTSPASGDWVTESFAQTSSKEQRSNSSDDSSKGKK